LDRATRGPMGATRRLTTRWVEHPKLTNRSPSFSERRVTAIGPRMARSRWPPTRPTDLPSGRRGAIHFKHAFAASRRDAPEPLQELPAPEGVGNAGRPMRRSLACEVVEDMHTSIHSGSTRITRHPRTQWFYGLYALSSVSHALLPPSPCGLRFCPTRLSRTSLRKT
jgi:hypothetical protein